MNVTLSLKVPKREIFGSKFFFHHQNLSSLATSERGTGKEKFVFFKSDHRFWYFSGENPFKCMLSMCLTFFRVHTANTEWRIAGPNI
jgi:hypothetical protein